LLSPRLHDVWMYMCQYTRSGAALRVSVHLCEPESPNSSFAQVPLEYPETRLLGVVLPVGVSRRGLVPRTDRLDQATEADAQLAQFGSAGLFAPFQHR